jgi:DNA-binding transcriptional LysR family regulator
MLASKAGGTRVEVCIIDRQPHRQPFVIDKIEGMVEGLSRLIHRLLQNFTSKDKETSMIGRVSDIDLRLLRIFATVVEAGGFAVATAKLNIAESTISQHMSDLEKRLGLRLCERGRSGFKLTKSGDEVYHATVELMQNLDGFRDRLSSLSLQVTGRFAVGLPDAIVTLERRFIVDGLRRLRQSAPDIHLQIHVLSPRELERQVIDGKIAAAIAPDHRRVAGLDYQPLFCEVNKLYCGRAHSLFVRNDAEISVFELETAGRISRGYLERFDAAFFETEDYAATVTETEAAALLINTGLYIGFLPEHYADEWVKSGEMRAIMPERFQFTSAFHLITTREAAADRRVVLLAECLGLRPSRPTV